MAKWLEDAGNWTRFRALPDLVEVDFHHEGPREVEYWQAMEDVERSALDALREAQKDGRRYVLFLHGSSTSRLGQTTARSVVRTLMRSPRATPFIERKSCVQHYSVFLAAIRPLPQEN